MAIDNRAASLTSMVDEYMKPVLSTQIVDAFCTYAWAATREPVTDGITPFNVTYWVVVMVWWIDDTNENKRCLFLD